MKTQIYFLLFMSSVYCLHGQTPILLHPDNPHYFLFRAKPTLLITSAEHYGMVLNAELDYKSYLNILQQHGFNQTRIFSGVYCEGDEYETERGSQYNWGDMQNTLSPRPGEFLTPWQRSAQPGYHNGGNKFDLDRWDPAYFQRLKDFCREAGKRGVVVEVVLFTANYTPKTWLNSPLNSGNNINQVGDVPYNEFHLLKHKSLIERQLAMVRKIVLEVNEFDNVYFEICNEPYWMKGIPQVEPDIKQQQFLPEIDEWQKLITRAIEKTEQQLPNRHLIAQNVANTYFKLDDLDTAVSVLNFHYAYPPASVSDNYHWNRPVAFDETAQGCNAPDRRREAWAFILSGGAAYSNLDWSFATDDPSGMGRNPTGKRQSGKEVRDQLQILHSTMSTFNFIKSTPIDSTFYRGLPDGIQLYGLRMGNEDYIFYWMKKKKITLTNWTCPLAKGNYEIQHIDPLDGKIVDRSVIRAGSTAMINLPSFGDDLVTRIKLKR